jgi:hypothetical protein
MKEEKEVEIEIVIECETCKHKDELMTSEICFPCINCIEDNWEAEDVR